jgi:hypothetical protein
VEVEQMEVTQHLPEVLVVAVVLDHQTQFLKELQEILLPLVHLKEILVVTQMQVHQTQIEEAVAVEPLLLEQHQAVILQVLVEQEQLQVLTEHQLQEQVEAVVVKMKIVQMVVPQVMVDPAEVEEEQALMHLIQEQ